MDGHGIPRPRRARTAAELDQERDKIVRYRALEDLFRALRGRPDDLALLPLTTQLLRLNPEYYTVWNARRRSLTSGCLSRRPSGSSGSTASPSSLPTATASTYSAASLSPSSAATPQRPGHRIAGKSGTIAEEEREVEEGVTGGVADTTGRPGEDKAVDDGTERQRKQEQEDQEKAQASDLEILQTELRFTLPLLIEFPKCYWLWNHRSWTLAEAIRRLPAPSARALWEEELRLDSKMLARDRRNFHAWGYRRELVARLESPALGGASMVEQEFDYTTRMIRADLSNFSAWHNRVVLIPRLLRERGADAAVRRTFFDEELALVKEGLNVGPEDQSLWYYHQFLILNLTENKGQTQITPDLTVDERVSYVRREIEDIKDLLEDYDDVKWIYEALMEYSVSLSQLEGRAPDDEERVQLKNWLGQLKKLDPTRKGRWSDVEKEQGLT